MYSNEREVDLAVGDDPTKKKGDGHNRVHTPQYFLDKTGRTWYEVGVGVLFCRCFLFTHVRKERFGT